MNREEKKKERKNGLGKNLIRKIKKMKIGHTKKDCTVCFEGFCKGEIIRKLPCGHIFHNKCIKPWLRVNIKCPNCRCNIKDILSK